MYKLHFFFFSSQLLLLQLDWKDIETERYVQGVSSFSDTGVGNGDGLRTELDPRLEMVEARTELDVLATEETETLRCQRLLENSLAERFLSDLGSSSVAVDSILNGLGHWFCTSGDCAGVTIIGNGFSLETRTLFPLYLSC